QPPAPPVAHVLQLERVEQGGRGLQVVAQRLALRVHVEPDPAAPGAGPDLLQAGLLTGEAAGPVLALGDAGVLAVEVVAPSVEAADELPAVAAGVPGARRGVDQAAAPVRADVVVRPDLLGAGADHDEGVVHDLVGQVVADLRDLLHPAGLLPDPGPQLVPLGPGVLRG